MNKKKRPIEQLEPFNIIVFGGCGDLAMRKIYPALFHRYLDGQFGDAFNIIAVTRKQTEVFPFQDELTKFIKASMKEEKNITLDIKNFARKIKLMLIQNHTVEDYQELANFLNDFKGFQNIYYYSTPSSVFGNISKTLMDANLVDANSKVVLEKPLGNSLETSNHINAEVTQAFQERKRYKI